MFKRHQTSTWSLNHQMRHRFCRKLCASASDDAVLSMCAVNRHNNHSLVTAMLPVCLHCFLQAQPKHLGTYVLSGPVLAGLTEAYVQAINDGAVPTIATAWQVCVLLMSVLQRGQQLTAVAAVCTSG